MIVFLILIGVAVIVFYRKAIADDVAFLKQEPKRWLYEKWKEWGEPFVIAVILAVIIRTFLVGPYKIPTASMEPTLMGEPNGDRIFVDKLSYRFRAPKRGEVVVFKYPGDEGKFQEFKLKGKVFFKYPTQRRDFVKRLIAFGGETVEIRDGGVYINGNRIENPANIRSYYYYNRNDWTYGKEGQQFQVPTDSYFVLGDNSAHSSDSRNWGFVPKKNLIGRAIVVWWPPKRIGQIK